MAGTGIITELDTALMWVLHQWTSCELFDAVMPFITKLGDSGLVWIVLALVMLARKSTRIIGVTMAIALIIGHLAGTVIIKNLLERPRPFVADPTIELLIKAPSEFSFPSGHSASSFAAAVSIAFYNSKGGAAALVLAFLIAFSRVYLMVHYPFDVLAGALLGVFAALISKQITAAAFNKTKLKSNEK